MTKTLVSAMALFLATAASAQQAQPPAASTEPQPVAVKVSPKLDQMIRSSLPVCGDEKIAYEAMVHKLPPNMTGTVVKIESNRSSCAGQYLTVTSTQGDFYIGIPWFLDDEQGTIEEKLKHFTWTHLQDDFDVKLDRTGNRSGLFNVTLSQTTERGKLPLEGEIDPAGTVFFLGHFHPMDKDYRAERLKSFEPYLGQSPATGAAKPVVTVVEFSDFECPSCQHASAYMKPILEHFGEKVRYVRYDLPLIANHPWALAAAINGRAIWRQKPEAFWEYKKQVYANQDNLNAFTIGDFARGFAKENELDLAKFDADVASESIKSDLIKGAGVALSNDVRATPSYLVNGTLVDPGNDGKALESYVAGLVK